MKIKKFSEFNSKFISVSPFYEQGEPFQLDINLGVDGIHQIRTEYTKYQLIYDVDRYVSVDWLSIPLDNPKVQEHLESYARQLVSSITKVTSQRFWDWRGVILSKSSNKAEEKFLNLVRKFFNQYDEWSENERSDFIVYIYDQS